MRHRSYKVPALGPDAGMDLTPLPLSFYRDAAERVAPRLIGRLLVRRRAEELLVLRIVETEAYLGAPDRASHAAGGRRTPRNESLYLPGGHAYVYFVYGMHWCLNAVCGGADEGSAVLLRAGEPLVGEVTMSKLRGFAPERRLRPGDIAGGPAKLADALAVDGTLDGVRLDGGELWIAAGDPVSRRRVARGPRIGVAYAGEAAAWPLRFAERGNDHVSRPRL
jgi:DNA-3-methyladenine glycosylase